MPRGERLCSPKWHWEWSADIKHSSHLPPTSQPGPLRIASPGYFERVDTQRDKTEMNSRGKKHLRERTEVGDSKDSLSVWVLKNQRTRGSKEWEGRKRRNKSETLSTWCRCETHLTSRRAFVADACVPLLWWAPNLLVLTDRSIAT